MTEVKNPVDFEEEFGEDFENEMSNGYDPEFDNVKEEK